MTDKNTPAVERLDLEQPDSHMGRAYMKGEPYGDYVRYKDYRAILSSLTSAAHEFDIMEQTCADLSAQLEDANQRHAAAIDAVATARDAALLEAARIASGRKGDGTATLEHPYDKGYLAACDVCAAAILALRDKPAPGVTVREANWQWWAGDNDEWFTVGPCDTKEEAIQQAIEDEVGLWFDKSQDPPCLMQAFHVVEARQDQLKLSDWVDAEQIIERADEALADSDRVSCENGDGPWFEATPDQDVDLTRRIKLACDEWQTAHGLVFHSNTFSHQRNSETIKPAIAGGGDE